MKLLKEIVRDDGLDLQGRTFICEAARGIILEQHNLLMIYSVRNGDYKLPGGGIEPGEAHEVALARELQEECGALLSKIQRPFGKVIEYGSALEQGYDIFKMTSFYYLCQIEEALGMRNLDPYEEELGFVLRWVGINVAIHTNASLLQFSHPNLPGWMTRELFVLQRVRAELI